MTDQLSALMALATEYADAAHSYAAAQLDCDYSDIVEQMRVQVGTTRAALESALRAALAQVAAMDAKPQRLTDEQMDAALKALSRCDSGFWSRDGTSQSVLIQSVYDAIVLGGKHD
jgi:hypothetical protein